MRTLTNDELAEVSGGVVWAVGIGAGIGAATGLASSLHEGLGWRDTTTNMMLGAMAGLAGGMATTAAAGGIIVRSAWALRSVGIGSTSAGGAVSTGSGQAEEEDS